MHFLWPEFAHNAVMNIKTISESKNNGSGVLLKVLFALVLMTPLMGWAASDTECGVDSDCGNGYSCRSPILLFASTKLAHKKAIF